MSNSTHFDYIILGAGASGLMLADAMISDAFFSGKSILILDKDAKQINDRTWCFWEKDKGKFDALVYKEWNHIYFAGKQFSKRYSINPYTYKMIRGIDFYASLLEKIETHPNVFFKQAEVVNLSDDGETVGVFTAEDAYTASKVFNSIFSYEMIPEQRKYPVLQQHFIGWFVKTKKPIFDADQATYMDFSIPQKGNTRFMYVLPTSETEALVEYTLFSKDLLSKEEYEKAIEEYIRTDLGCSEYEITETEMGSIPMTCYDFHEHHSENIRNIGTAGGWAKPSTGYTFMSTTKKIPKLVDYIKTGKPLHQLHFKNKFWYYDLLFLDVLHTNNAIGHKVFESLFKNRTPQQVFKFLDEESNFIEDVGNMMASPKIPFTKALFRRLF